MARGVAGSQGPAACQLSTCDPQPRVVEASAAMRMPACFRTGLRVRSAIKHTALTVELELELIQPHIAQKPVLRGEVGCACVALRTPAAVFTPVHGGRTGNVDVRRLFLGFCLKLNLLALLLDGPFGGEKT